MCYSSHYHHNIQTNNCRRVFLVSWLFKTPPCVYFVSSRQLTEAGCSSAAGSHSKSFDHSHYRPYQGGGGDSGDALSVTSVSSSGSDLEDVNASFLSDSPEGHERKVRKKSLCKTSVRKFHIKYQNILCVLTLCKSGNYCISSGWSTRTDKGWIQQYSHAVFNTLLFWITKVI